jgi:A/G-specific adenine glycosylase
VPHASQLLDWYDLHRRHLPWRALPGQAGDPYHIWLSEIMLQQTTVVAVVPYYEKFLMRFPTVAALADAPTEAVMQAWAGLGYYARARNLHACAQAVVALGGFPHDIDGLRSLPGIGPYTAAAIAAIAFGVPAVPVDGNVERVLSRLCGITDPLPRSKPAIAAAARQAGEATAARARPSDFAQALFDLGATICTPTKPNCLLCPWQGICVAHRLGIAGELPRKLPKKKRPVRYGAVFWLIDAAGRVLLRKRPPSGLLGGMTELPGTQWRPAPWDAAGEAPMAAPWRAGGKVVHVFTHFELRLDVYVAQVATISADGFLLAVDELGSAALPSVMRKCVVAALSSSSPLGRGPG